MGQRMTRSIGWDGFDSEESDPYWILPEPYLHAHDAPTKFIGLCKWSTTKLELEYKILMRFFHYNQLEESDCSFCVRGESKCRSQIQSIHLILMFRDHPHLPKMHWRILPKKMRDELSHETWDVTPRDEQRRLILASETFRGRWRYLQLGGIEKMDLDK